MTYNHSFPPSPPSPFQPQYLECPKCGRHTVVMHGESLYVCLSCDWARDLSRVRDYRHYRNPHHSSGRFPWPLLIFLVLLAMAMI